MEEQLAGERANEYVVVISHCLFIHGDFEGNQGVGCCCSSSASKTVCWLLRRTHSSSAFKIVRKKRNVQLDAHVLSIDPAAERADQSQPRSLIGQRTPRQLLISVTKPSQNCVLRMVTQRPVSLCIPYTAARLHFSRAILVFTKNGYFSSCSKVH